MLVLFIGILACVVSRGFGQNQPIDEFTLNNRNPDDLVCRIRDEPYRNRCIRESVFYNGIEELSPESFVASIDYIKGGTTLFEIYTKFGDKTVGQILEGIYQARQSVKNQSPNLPFFNHMFRALAILYGSSTCRLMVSQLPLENHFFQNRLIRCSTA